MNDSQRKRLETFRDDLNIISDCLQEIDIECDITTPESHHINKAAASIIDAYQSLEKILKL